MQYQVLLLLTDGVIHDMPDTKKLLCEASSLPCSVIIVGVGTADFGMMEELDCDGGLLRANGITATRDVVQFVEYLKAMKKGNLSDQVLKELPEQVCQYMKNTGWKPNRTVSTMNAMMSGQLLS